MFKNANILQMEYKRKYCGYIELLFTVNSIVYMLL